MPHTFVTRSGLVSSAVDLTNAINVEMSGVATSNYTVVSNQTRIKKIRVCIARTTLVASVGVTLILQISGSGVVGQPHEIPIGVHVEDTTTTGGAKISNPYEIDCDIELAAGPIVLAVFAKGVDAGNEEVTVGLEIW